MTLVAGARIRHFEILQFIGAGGMGAVYRARDLSLEREVALKVLPPEFARDAERLARFRREAQAIAALNHPNVVTIHAVEEVDGVHFLAMELIEGKTLAGLIPPGGLPLPDLLRIAVPIADALVAAHARGIVHRDLKPANVMVARDGRVKVLDFGLAKVSRPPARSDDPTLSSDDLTARHQVTGTPAYMSPEQVQGASVDVRSDIFSLGVILYEMAAGARPFRGASSIAVMSAILKDTPAPLGDLRPDLPPDFARLVRRCLAKEPERRYQTALDVRTELEELQPSSAAGLSSQPALRSRRWLWTSAGASALLLAALAAFLLGWRPAGRPSPGGALRATFGKLTSHPGAEFFPSLSPDGKWIVYSGEGAGNRDIYLQSVGGQTAINLTADSPDDDEQPTFSPDGERIAFRSAREGGGIFVMGRTGEAVRRVTRLGFNPAWSRDGAKLAFTRVRTEIRPQNAEERSHLLVVPVSGGEPQVVHAGDSMLPSWSPDGRRIAFSGRFHTGVVTAGVSNLFTIPAGGGTPVQVTRGDFLDWNPVWSPDGAYLYFVSDRSGSPNIWRLAVDQATGEPRGDAEPLSTPAAFAAHLSISADGRRIAFTSVVETQNIQRLRFDPVAAAAVGEPEPVTTGSRFWSSPDPSPDGEWVVFYSQVQPEGDLFVARADGSGVMRQLTSDAAIDRVPRWSPDGAWISMFSDRTGELEVWKIRVDGSELQQVTGTGGGVNTWSPDGTRIAVTRSATLPEAWTNEIVDPQRPHTGQTPVRLPVPPPPYPQFVPNSWSPDGRWIAGQNGYAVRGLSIYDVDARRYERLIDHGEWPVWFPDGRRILFVSRGREFNVIDVRTRAITRVFSVRRDTLGPPRLSRDGRAAYFSRRITEADIWLATIQGS